MGDSKFFEMATFSKVPIVNDYFKDIKSMYHDGKIVIGIELFARWLEDTNRLSKTTIRIAVNGVWHESPSTKITYQDVCILAYGKVIKGLTCTWTVKNGKGGHLTFSDEGFPLSIKNGTHFNIVSTSNS